MLHNMRQQVTPNVVVFTHVYSAFGPEVYDSDAGNIPFSRAQGEVGVQRDAADRNYARNRFVDAIKGRFKTPDPIGTEGGYNLLEFVENDPVNLVDPSGEDWLDASADFFSGWGDVLSFGLTRYGRKYAGDLAGVGDADTVVDHDSTGYKFGESIGWIHSIALGAAGGVASGGVRIVAGGERVGVNFVGQAVAHIGSRIAIRNGERISFQLGSKAVLIGVRKGAGTEFSHWISREALRNEVLPYVTRWLGPSIEKRYGPEGLKMLEDAVLNKFGRSPLNGNFVSASRHYLHDVARYPRGWRGYGIADVPTVYRPLYHALDLIRSGGRSLDRLPEAVRLLDRVPKLYYGAAVGNFYGGPRSRIRTA